MPHLMRIPVGRASSSLVFLRFRSTSSEDARKSFTSSTVMSPVVSNGFSMLLLGESMGPGEKAPGCSSGDRSLSEGECWPSELRGTWVPFACGSFGVTVELLLRQEVSWSRATSSRHSGSVTFLALSEKRSNSDGEIR